MTIHQNKLPSFMRHITPDQIPHTRRKLYGEVMGNAMKLAAYLKANKRTLPQKKLLEMMRFECEHPYPRKDIIIRLKGTLNATRRMDEMVEILKMFK